MPKSNEPIKIVYPLNQQQQQHQHQHQQQQHQQQQISHQIITSQQIQNINNSTIVTMNSQQQTTSGNRVTFPLPNGTINIQAQATQQPQQQIMHAVSASGIPTATTIKTINAGGHQSQHNATGLTQHQQQNHPVGQTTTQTLGNQQNIVGTPTMIPTNSNIVQIVGVRPQTPTQTQQKNVTPLPRVVIGGPHMVGTRPTSPAITLSALQSGQTGPALILKTENGFQLLRVGPPPTATPVVSSSASIPSATATVQNMQANSAAGNQTIRLQTVPAVSRFSGPPLALRKTIVTTTQQQVKQKQNVISHKPTTTNKSNHHQKNMSISTSATNIVVNSVTSTNASQQHQILATSSSSNSSVQPTIASVAPVPSLAQSSITTTTTQTFHHSQHHQQAQNQQQSQNQHVIHQQQQQSSQQQQQQQQQQHQQISSSPNSGATQSPTSTQQQNSLPQINTKEKCRKFLANLIELSSREPKPVEKSVRSLIQDLVDANVEPEEFCDRLERLLNASPQPCLIGFLKKSLPLLRTSLFTKELVIDGIKPPPQQVVGIIGSTTLTQQLPRIQAQIRPIGQQTTTIGQTQVRMVNPTGGSRPIGQTTIKQTTGGVRIQGPIQTLPVNSNPRIMNAQIRPINSGANLVQQSPPALQPVSGTQTVFTPQSNVVQIRASSVNRSPTTVQIRATTPVRATSKNTIAVTQVKVGQTQIKPITVQNTSFSNTIPTVSINNSISSAIPISTNTLTISTPTATSANVASNMGSANKVVTVKVQGSQQQSIKKETKEKEKKQTSTASSFFQQSLISASSSMYGDDDINDVAAMGGVNLAEESQKILGSTELIGTQIRSCKDEVFLHLPTLQNKIRQMMTEIGLEEPSQEVAVLFSHACQERLKNIVEKLAVIAEHRIDAVKVDPRYEVTKDVRGQLKFLEELDKAELKRHEEQEREMLLRAAKSRSKTEDPEQAKLKAKAKEMQRAEMEELRQRDANMTALQAIGPRKKPKLENDVTNLSNTPGTSGLGASGISTAPLRPRIKRVNMRDMIFFMEQEKEFMHSETLYKAYLK